MFRPTALKLVLGVILVAGTYFLCINAHIDILPCMPCMPCKQTRQDLRTHGVETRDESCSLLQTQGDYFQPPERAELTPAGYGVAFMVVGVAPLLAGFLFGSMFGRRRD